MHFDPWATGIKSLPVAFANHRVLLISPAPHCDINAPYFTKAMGELLFDRKIAIGAMAVAVIAASAGCSQGSSPLASGSTSAAIAQPSGTSGPIPSSSPTPTTTDVMTFGVDRKDSAGYTSTVSVSIAPVKFDEDIAGEPPGFTDLVSPISMKGSVTNTTPGRSYPTNSGTWGVEAVYPVESPACLFAKPDSPVAKVFSGDLTATDEKNCYFNVSTPYIPAGGGALPVSGTMQLRGMQVEAAGSSGPFIAPNFVRINGVPEQPAKDILSALNKPTAYILITAADSYAESPVKCTVDPVYWKSPQLHQKWSVLDATPGFTC